MQGILSNGPVLNGARLERCFESLNDLRATLCSFYTLHNPSKVNVVENVLLENLCESLQRMLHDKEVEHGRRMPHRQKILQNMQIESNVGWDEDGVNTANITNRQYRVLSLGADALASFFFDHDDEI